MLLKEFITKALEQKYLGERIWNKDKSTTFVVDNITVEDGGVDPQWEITLCSGLCCAMNNECGTWQQQNNPKGGNLAPKELEDRWRKGWIEQVSMSYGNEEMPEIIEAPEPDENDNPDLSACEQCDEKAWDGYICHACGMKNI